MKLPDWLVLPRKGKFTIYHSILLFMLVGGLILPVWWVLSSASDDLGRIFKTLPYPASWRGVRFATNEEFASYLEFLRGAVPEDGVLGIPPREETTWALSNTPFMQFFLAPRRVVNCTAGRPDCAQALAAQGGYLVVLGSSKFPPVDLMDTPDHLSMFNDKWGVYAPSEIDPVQGVAALALNTLLAVFWQLIVIFLWLLVMIFVGYLMLQSWFPGLPPGTKLALGFGLGIGWHTLVLFLLLFLEGVLVGGRALNPVSVIISTVSWVVFALAFAWVGRRRGFVSAKATINGACFWYLLFLGIAIIAGFIGVGKAFSVSDEFFIWGAKGYGITYEGLVDGTRNWGTQTTHYPLQVPLWIASVKALTGDGVAQSKLLFPAFYAGLIVLIFDFLRSRWNFTFAGLSTLGLAFSPFIFRQAALSYANLPLAYALTAAVLLVLYASRFRIAEPIKERQYLLLAGVFLGLSAWTRPEGVFLSLVVAGLAVAGFTTWWNGKSQVTRQVPNLARLGDAEIPLGLAARTKALLIPFAAIELSWLFSNTWVGIGRDGSAVEFLPAVKLVLSGSFHIQETAYILKYLGQQISLYSLWGLAGLGFLVFFTLALFSGKPGYEAIFLLACGAGCATVILAIYYVLSFGHVHDISWWVTTGLNRMFLPAVVLAWTGIFSWLSPKTTSNPTGVDKNKVVK